MRRRLTTMSLVVTSIVVISFVVPLGILVSDLASDRALSEAERDAERIARFLAVFGQTRDVHETLEALGGDALSRFPRSVVMPDDSIVGEELLPGETVDQARAGSAVRIPLESGEVVHVPVLQSDGSIAVVRLFVSTEELTAGVTASWLTLALMGALLLAIAALVSDRMARSIVEPVAELSNSAIALGEGDTGVRVSPGGPKEIRDAGVEFNRLADKLERLLQLERESAADLSHRLRTPLMAVQLDAEALPPGDRRDRLLEDIDDLARRVDFVIWAARKEATPSETVTADFAAILAERVAFWAPLAEEQQRTFTYSGGDGSGARVHIDSDDVCAMIDALLGNAVAHTPEGSPVRITLDRSDHEMVLVVEDGGPGFHDEKVLRRGVSGAAGTGLGLDIARRTAESGGGHLSIGPSAGLGGASVRASIPLIRSTGEAVALHRDPIQQSKSCEEWATRGVGRPR